jgi:hypothetical protein
MNSARVLCGLSPLEHLPMPRHWKNPGQDEDAVDDLFYDLFEESRDESYSSHVNPRNWRRRTVLVIGLLAAAFIVLAIAGIRM